MGVANDHSIAWGIAKTLAAEGAELAFTYQGEALGRRVKPLARSLGADLVVPCDVERLETVDAAVDAVAERFGALDFLVHGIGLIGRNGRRYRRIIVHMFFYHLQNLIKHVLEFDLKVGFST